MNERSDGWRGQLAPGTPIELLVFDVVETSVVSIDAEMLF